MKLKLKFKQISNKVFKRQNNSVKSLRTTLKNKIKKKFLRAKLKKRNKE